MVYEASLRLSPLTHQHASSRPRVEISHTRGFTLRVHAFVNHMFLTDAVQHVQPSSSPLHPFR